MKPRKPRTPKPRPVITVASVILHAPAAELAGRVAAAMFAQGRK